VGSTCTVHGRCEKFIRNFDRGKLSGKDQIVYVGMNGGLISKLVLKE
jgi:hypothetical protein